MDIDPSPADQRPSRKHLRTSDDEDIEWSSDVSGRFDDADEPDLDGYKSPSSKSAKRRKSNDWPLPEEAADYGNNGSRGARSGNGSLGPNYKSSPRTSPRTSATSLRNRHKATTDASRNRLARRSRFVEATMSDSVSEKPPSELFRDHKSAPGHRGSGIFRFGKAIAAAFNPFGIWNRNSTEANKSPQKDALASAEEAYAELKRAGYKGTNKGAYMQNQQVDPAHANQTWQAMQDHRHSMPNAPSQTEPSSPLRSPVSQLRSPSKSSKRTSFQDLRKATSFGLPFIKHSDQQVVESSACLDHPSEDSENNGIRRQKSRKELSRESKLIKKVSNLEEKLDRARRELRQLSGNEERKPSITPELENNTAPSFDMNPGSYPRKFVPGALPTLPSERLLDQQAMAYELSENGAAQITALPSVEARSVSPEETHSMTKSSKRFSRESRPSYMGKESSSRKRKPSAPEPLASRQPPKSSSTDYDDDRLSEYKYLVDAGFIQPTRQSKWAKLESGESPGSVERKRQLNQQASMAALDGGSFPRRSQSLQPQTSSVDDNRSPKPKMLIHSSPLRTPVARSYLYPSSPPSNTTSASKSDSIAFDFSSPPPPVSKAHESFYLQSHRQLDPDRLSRTSPLKSSPPGHRRRHSYHDDLDIPPVPPLPEQFRKYAAKVTPPPNKPRNPARDSAPAILPQQTLSALKKLEPKGGEYRWPDDIF